MNTPKHVSPWAPLRRALDRIRQYEAPTGRRVNRG